MIQHAYWLPLTFQPLSLKWVDLIGDTLVSEIETNVLKALKMVTMSDLILGFVSLVKKALRPQITSPGICKKARKTLRKQTFILTVADY
jgi:hypothetical protein